MKNIFFALLFLTRILQCQTIDNIISSSKKSDLLRCAQWSLSAKYVDTGEIIINENSESALAPASGLKLLTTAAALDMLGSEFKFKTKLYYTGNIISDGILNGNLILVGAGDPTFGSSNFDEKYNLNSVSTIFISTLKKFNIKTINGKFIIDNSLFSGSNISRLWFWEDLGNYYGAQVSALSINDNLYKLHLSSKNKIGSKINILGTEPKQKIKFENHLKASHKYSGDNAYIYSAPNQYFSILRGTIPAGKNIFTIKGSIPNPAKFALDFFVNLLHKNKINVLKKSKISGKKINLSEAKLLIEFTSPPLSEIVKFTNKKSFNLYAETLLRILAIANHKTGSLKNGIKFLKKYMINLNLDILSLNIYDGNGLSRSNTISTNLMTEFLRKIKTKKYFSVFYNSLGIAGKIDDISAFKYFGKGTIIENNAHIKSGYMEGVRSHSGYVKSKSGRLIAFSFIANNFSGSVKKINEIHKLLMIKLAELN